MIDKEIRLIKINGEYEEIEICPECKEPLVSSVDIDLAGIRHEIAECKYCGGLYA